MRSSLSLWFLILMSACTTSKDYVAGKKYVDPTGVKTIDDSSSALGSLDVEELKTENARLLGEVENLQFALSEKDRVHAEKIKELEAKNLGLAEEVLKSRGATPTIPDQTVSTETLTSEKTGAALLWDLAKKDIEAKRFEASLSPLSQISKNYPKNGLAVSAYLARGFVEYELGRYKDSALTLNTIIEKFPKSKQARSAWFGQAASFYRLGEKQDAILIFEELIKRYPKTLHSKLAFPITKSKAKPPESLLMTFADWSQ